MSEFVRGVLSYLCFYIVPAFAGVAIGVWFGWSLVESIVTAVIVGALDYALMPRRRL